MPARADAFAVALAQTRAELDEPRVRQAKAAAERFGIERQSERVLEIYASLLDPSPKGRDALRDSA